MQAIVIGAGMGGLAAAIDLARQGAVVTVLEQSDAPGGKMRQIGPHRIDAGPTVFTMRHVFDSLFHDAGADLASAVTLEPASTLARHTWGATPLDLYSDLDRSAAAIDAFCGEGAGFRALMTEAARMYQVLDRTFIQAPRPTALSLTRAAGVGAMLAIRPFDTLWNTLGRHLRDPRLRQLFGRYATYAGSSPYRAPATLMLIAHVERAGVWQIAGGMHQLARAMAGLLVRLGGTIRYGAGIARIEHAGGRASGVVLHDGTRLAADAVVLNADPAALAAGLFGPGLGPSAAVPAPRSLSAITWAGLADVSGFSLAHHTVFFSPDYATEFRTLEAGRIPTVPTIYLCAQDRTDAGARATTGPERLLVLINAPPAGDRTPPLETAPCLHHTTAHLARAGLRLTLHDPVMTTPGDFHRLYPATGGALYGAPVHGAMASFRRPGSRTALPGLYLAGGATHPGAGVPMAALSGRLAAAAIMQDRGSTARSRPMAMRGGMSTPSATMAPTG